MQQNEKRLWDIIKGWFPPNSSLNRIESHSTAVGFPDVEYCVPYAFGSGIRYRGVLELKAVNKATDVVIFRPAQIGWLTKRIRAGDNPLLVLYIREDSLVSIISFVSLMGGDLDDTEDLRFPPRPTAKYLNENFAGRNVFDINKNPVERFNDALRLASSLT
jgi:hypothetical protein